MRLGARPSSSKIEIQNKMRLDAKYRPIIKQKNAEGGLREVPDI